MIVDIIVVGNLKVNCYVLTINNDVLVIDPGAEYIKIKPYLENKNILGALVTHHHFDHIGELKHFDKIYDFHNLKEEITNIGPFEFEVIKTPGHKEDCLTFYFKKENIMFTGDFLFNGTIGRTDFAKGNFKEMISSIEKIKKYPNVLVYPGHGQSTTLNNEKENNVYFLN